MALAAIAGGAIYLIATRGQKWPESEERDDEPVPGDSEIEQTAPLGEVVAESDIEVDVQLGLDVDGDAGVPPDD